MRELRCGNCRIIIDLLFLQYISSPESFCSNIRLHSRPAYRNCKSAPTEEDLQHPVLHNSPTVSVHVIRANHVTIGSPCVSETSPCMPPISRLHGRSSGFLEPMEWLRRKCVCILFDAAPGPMGMFGLFPSSQRSEFVGGPSTLFISVNTHPNL